MTHVPTTTWPGVAVAPAVGGGWVATVPVALGCTGCGEGSGATCLAHAAMTMGRASSISFRTWNLLGSRRAYPGPGAGASTPATSGPQASCGQSWSSLV